MKRDPNLRLTVSDTTYYQQPGMETLTLDVGYSRFLQDNEQAFQRIGFVGVEAKPLELGWIKSVSCLSIQNKQELAHKKIPSEEELQELSRHVLELFYEGSEDRFLVSPGESMRVRPSNLVNLRLRSQFGLTRYIATMIPE